MQLYIKRCNNWRRIYEIYPSVIKFIPQDTYCDISNLLKDLTDNGNKNDLYPISEKSWINFVQLKELNNAFKDIRLFN